MQEQDRQIIKSTTLSSSRTITTPSRPLRLQTIEAPGTKGSCGSDRGRLNCLETFSMFVVMMWLFQGKVARQTYGLYE
jgi:hypothetical protein